MLVAKMTVLVTDTVMMANKAASIIKGVDSAISTGRNPQ